MQGFVYFDSHTPFELVVPPEAIASWFYKLLYALQGQRGTFWTDVACACQCVALEVY